MLKFRVDRHISYSNDRLNCFIIYSNLETSRKAGRDKICNMDEANDVGAHSSPLRDSRRNMV